MRMRNLISLYMHNARFHGNPPGQKPGISVSNSNAIRCEIANWYIKYLSTGFTRMSLYFFIKCYSVLKCLKCKQQTKNVEACEICISILHASSKHVAHYKTMHPAKTCTHTQTQTQRHIRAPLSPAKPRQNVRINIVHMHTQHAMQQHTAATAAAAANLCKTVIILRRMRESQQAPLAAAAAAALLCCIRARGAAGSFGNGDGKQFNECACLQTR